jgi:hypothetical protein
VLTLLEQWQSESGFRSLVTSVHTGFVGVIEELDCTRFGAAVGVVGFAGTFVR